MPQLNPEFFLTQIVWLAISFTVLYLILWRVALPRVAECWRRGRTRSTTIWKRPRA